MRRALTAFAVMATLSAPAIAGTDIAFAPGMTQSQFQQFSEDLGAALSYRDPTPGSPLGQNALSVHVGTSETRLDPQAARAGTDSKARLSLTTLSLNKGLPLGIDIGGSYTAVPNSNIRLLGVESSYALFRGSQQWPAVTLRATYSHLAGVPELDFSTAGLELTVSRRVGHLTPYAGFGRLHVASSPHVPGLLGSRFWETKAFAGVALQLGTISLGIEADRIGGITSAAASLGFDF
ncbi:MAG TPA: hypothetical protein VFN52_00780 [Acidiferrobacteraceae bacterium]|nr:hypothetical protein [Acidiferrobacteraceae bacterium]